MKTVQLMPLVRMFHNRTLNNKINKLHERASRIVCKNDNSSFQELLDNDNSITIHQRNLQTFAVEMYKVKNNISPIPINARTVYCTGVCTLPLITINLEMLVHTKCKDSCLWN